MTFGAPVAQRPQVPYPSPAGGPRPESWVPNPWIPRPMAPSFERRGTKYKQKYMGTENHVAQRGCASMFEICSGASTTENPLHLLLYQAATHSRACNLEPRFLLCAQVQLQARL